MEEEREWRIGLAESIRENTRERKREGEGEKRKQESVEEPYFARSSAGVQILNRILDECISLTRLRPVSTRRARGWAKGEATARGGYDGYEETRREVGSERDNKSVLSSATMGRMEETERRV